MRNKDADQTFDSDPIAMIRDRQSVRAFLDKPVSKDTIQQILELARWAPSGVNTQPWQVAVVGPKAREVIASRIIQARETGVPEDPDYQYYPSEWKDPYKARRKACGMALYGALNIKIDDVDARKKQWYRNYRFFDAPVAFIFYIDKVLCKGSWMDFGMFIQNVMLASRALGLETCPQAALAEYPDIIRQALGLSENYHIVCGMALGYADWEHPINQYRTTRVDIKDFTQWHD